MGGGVPMPASYHSHQLAEPFRSYSPREGSRSSRLCWLGRRNQSLSHMWDVMVYSALTWASEKRSPEDSHSHGFIDGVWSWATGTASEESGKELVFEPSDERWFDYTTSLRSEEKHTVFLQRKYNSCNSIPQLSTQKLTTMIRNLYSYKTYNHAVFTGFLPGFISVHSSFYFVAWDKDLFPE